MAVQTDIAEVIKNIQDEITTIVRGEIALAKQELIPEATKAGVIAGLFGGASYVALSGAAVLFSAFGFLWALGFQHWFGLDLLTALFWGFFVMAVLLFVLAAALGFAGTKVPKPGPPNQTIENTKENLEALKAAFDEATAEASALPLTGAPAEPRRPELG